LTYNFMPINLPGGKLVPGSRLWCGVLVGDWLNLFIKWLMRWHNGLALI